ncbi:MAG: transglutaminase domain-containing protein [Bacteroidales bacterium]|nr:transglutaminase domain-containing protein [Bacteroidales bacterium]
MKKLLSLSIIALLLFSCQLNHKIVPDDVQIALDAAKANKTELQKLIDYYDNDSLKLEAAYFLIRNMPGQCYSKKKIVDTAGQDVGFRVLAYENYDVMRTAWDSVENQIGAMSFRQDTLIYDLEFVSSEYLINNIDLAFKAWENPWAKNLSFDEFCEYILPYRSSNEPVEDWRTQFYDRYYWLRDSMKEISDPVEAATLINREIKTWYKFDPLFYRHPTDLGLSEMLDYKRGRCEDMTNLAIYAMRSQGIPVMSDYTPAWPNTGNNHAWNASLTKDKEVVIFMGGLDDPYVYQLNNLKAKVYRKTFSKQKNSLAMIAPDYESLPAWLAKSNYRDVTADYIDAVNVEVELKDERPDSINFAYLSVFNSGEWKAIHWGQIKEKTVSFSDMGRGIVYMPCYYKNGQLLEANKPFLLDENANITYFAPDTLNLTSVRLYSTTKRTIVKTTDEIEKANFKDATEYILQYWDEKWITIDTVISQKDKALVFSSVPRNALYWLIERDSRKEERIFTFDKDGIHWW